MPNIGLMKHIIRGTTKSIYIFFFNRTTESSNLRKNKIFLKKKFQRLCVWGWGGGVPAGFSRGRAVRLLGPYHPWIPSSRDEGSCFPLDPCPLCCPGSRVGCGLAPWPGSCCWWPGALPPVQCLRSRPPASLDAALWLRGSEPASLTPPPPPPVS